MRWEVTTEKKKHIVGTTSSSEAVAYVRKKNKDTSALISVRLMPKNLVDTLKSKWRQRFGK